MPNIPISSLPLTTSVCSTALVPIVQNGVTFSTYACLVGGGGGGGCGGGNVTRLIAGTGVEISPSSGTGNVTVCVTGGGGTGNINCLIAGCGIILSPSSGVGNVTICNACPVSSSPMSGQYGEDSIVGNPAFNSSANSCYTFIGGGNQNNIGLSGICGNFSVIAGGCSNSINSSSYSFAIGRNNSMCNSSFTAILHPSAQYFNKGCSFIVNNLCSCGTFGTSSVTSNCALCFSCGSDCSGGYSKFGGYTPAGGGNAGVVTYGNGCCSVIRCGVNNIACGAFSSLIGGCNNKTTGLYSFITASTNSCDNGNSSVNILGLDSFVAPQGNTTFVNNIAPQALTQGCLVCISNGFLQNSSISVPPLENSCGCCSLAINGIGNCAGDCSFIAAGSNNLAICPFSSVLGGFSNYNCSSQSTIGGGFCNTILPAACNGFNFIGGGCLNTICPFNNCNEGNTIVGGECNTIIGNQSSILGGSMNLISSSNYSALGGGASNIICCSNYSFMGGGQCNLNSSSQGSVIVGGCNNYNFCSLNSSVLGGGNNKNEFSNYSTVSGGYGHSNQYGCYNDITSGSSSRITCSIFSSVVGGKCNIIQNTCYSIILNGIDNYIACAPFATTPCYSTILNGCLNIIDASYSLIGTGLRNQISGLYGCNVQGSYNTILNGKCNVIENFSSSFSTIKNGVCNVIRGNFGEITSGCLNTINGNFSYIGTGNCNCICGNFSSIIGGSCNTTCADYAGIFGCNIVNNTPCSFMSNQLRACNLFGAGAICADANGLIVPVTSDLRLKKDIKSINYGLKEINSLNPISYCWSDEYQNKNGFDKKIGFIAQEVKEIIPEAIYVTDDNLYGFDEKALSPVITKALQELELELSLIQIKLNSIRN